MTSDYRKPIQALISGENTNSPLITRETSKGSTLCSSLEVNCFSPFNYISLSFTKYSVCKRLIQSVRYQKDLHTV